MKGAEGGRCVSLSTASRARAGANGSGHTVGIAVPVTHLQKLTGLYCSCSWNACIKAALSLGGHVYRLLLLKADILARLKHTVTQDTQTPVMKAVV